MAISFAKCFSASCDLMAICHLSHYHLLSTTFFFAPKRLDPPVALRISKIVAARRFASIRSSEKSSDKVRYSRKRKSDEEICEELHEFISLAGLPIKRMPSLKVLSDNGRKDLAKAIKKRGYKTFSNVYLSSVTDEEVEENLSDEIEDENAYEEEGHYRIEGLAPSSEFSDLQEVEWDGLINNGTHTSETVEDYWDPLGTEQKNDTNEDKFDFSANGIVKFEEDPMHPLVGDYSSDELTNFEESSVLTVVNGPGNYVAINSLKALLDQKDTELSKLKQKIEEEKIELLKLQEKAKARIANVELTIRDNCCVIHDTEDKFKGLKEVQIELMADAKVVEIAGSFNGWQHRLQMNLNQSSHSEDPSNPRQPKVWSIVLLLYPGIYQIKFVVDGNWRVDPERELVTTDDFANKPFRRYRKIIGTNLSEGTEPIRLVL